MGNAAVIAGVAAAPLPASDEIRRTAFEVLQGPDYTLTETIPDFSWMDRIGEFFERLFRPILWGLDSLFRLSPVLYYLVVAVLFLMSLALLAHISYTIYNAIKARKSVGGIPTHKPQTELTPDGWEKRAEEALARQDYVSAIRCLLRACLLTLQLARKEAYPRGATNRACLLRFRGSAAFDPLRLLVETVDGKWYSGAGCSRDDYEACAGAYRQIRSLAAELRHA